ncbi:oligosaccharide flippase family protein [uncultured Paludibaculum sp.]|uniref:oligosaccharide flippase family protein n=1 Tax=uncultured Paludibaculum sp. TaxID=1765020 RepID=UPI002AAB9820|nr:oligosaccharide flippase family protein [uncultured Paludibaculum sp.]
MTTSNTPSDTLPERTTSIPDVGVLGRWVGWAAACSILLQITTITCAVIAARLLGIADFGRFSIAQSTAVMFLGVAGSGLGITATRYTARLEKTDPRRLGAILGVAHLVALVAAVVAGALLLLFSRSIAIHAYGRLDLEPCLRLTTPYLFFSALNAYQMGALVGLGAFRQMATVTALQFFVGVALTTSLTVSAGVNGAIIGASGAALANWLHCHRVLATMLRSRGIRLTYSTSSHDLRVLWEFALPAAVSSVLGTACMWLVGAMLVKQTNNVNEAAIFVAAGTLRQVIVFAPAIVQKVFAVPLSQMFGRINQADYRRFHFRQAAWNLLAAAAIAGVVWTGRGLVMRLFGRQFSDDGNVCAFVVVFAVLEAYAISAYQAIPATGRMWWQVAVIVLWCGILTSGAKEFVTAGGASGLAKAYCLAWLSSAVAYTLVSKYLLRNAPVVPAVVNA